MVFKNKRPKSQLISEQSLSSNGEEESRPKRKRHSKNSNEGISHLFIKPGHIDATTDLPFDEIKEEPLDDETDSSVYISEIDFSELAAQREKSNGLKLKVQIVIEEPDPDEFVKKEPQFYDEYGNGLVQPCSSAIRHGEVGI